MRSVNLRRRRWPAEMTVELLAEIFQRLIEASKRFIIVALPSPPFWDTQVAPRNEHAYGGAGRGNYYSPSFTSRNSILLASADPSSSIAALR